MFPECNVSCKRDLVLDKARSTAFAVQRQSHDQPEDVATIRSNKLLAQPEIDYLDIILREKGLADLDTLNDSVAQLRQFVTCR